MDEFRINKLKQAIEVQSRLQGEEAAHVAEQLNKETDWNQEFDYNKIVNRYLEAQGLLRNQVQKSCKIREGTRLNKG
ncbi:MAG TPA: hypothetical protein VIG45_04055 [Erysipelothrix sp.]